MLRRLLVEEVTGEPIELVSRALDGVVDRWRTEMMRNAGSDLARIREYAPINQWLGLRQEEMHTEDSRDAAVNAIVGWLASLTPGCAE
jgi:hypothetical protein